MKWILVVSLVLPLVAGTPAIGQRRTRARVKSTGAATPCDKAAAHPADPEARAKGVSDADLNAPAVIALCEAEAGAEPTSPRLGFQLARGYLKAGRVEDAVERLVEAAGGGHGGALAYLGDLYLDGAAGLEADPALAHSLYRRAAEAGFKPAKAVLAQFEDFTDRVAATDEEAAGGEEAALMSGPGDGTKYINPEIVENILKGDLDAVPFGELYTKAYLVNMAENIAEVCGEHFTSREVGALKLEAVEKSVEMTPQAGLTNFMGLLMQMAEMTQNPNGFVRRQAQAAQDQDQLPEEAMKDAFTLMKRHTCGSSGLSRFSKNLVSYVKNEDAPRISTDEMYARCQREARPSGRYDAKNFCICFVSAMSQTGVSRANRKGLSNDFWGTAQKMMAQKPDHYAMCNR